MKIDEFGFGGQIWRGMSQDFGVDGGQPPHQKFDGGAN